ncbi:calcium-binding and coiled-coil domain-containing protein 1-like isoform 3-T3 [Odontesthes bonariensis]|uniref:calcium-binding and coiled-coil domain-containing protein 1-like isoform X3 n=1 Tax=Odontesthes bonariensis TaxID=219752 RepID=UPI003F5822A4
MDKHPTVVFRNVGQLYFPQTRVECHYSLTSEHQWSSGDWIGIFEMGWSSLKQYYTYAWALVPEGYTERTTVDYCTLFQASYLPRPSSVEYQFVYVDKMGKVCSQSRPFNFCAPKPLEELETLKEEQDEEDGEEELMLVIPRAQLLQSRLEESLKKQEDLQQALDVAREKMEDKKGISKAARIEWKSERGAMREEITELRDNLRHSCEMLKKMEEKLKVETESSVIEVRGLQEHLEASDHVAESLRRELRELGTRQSHTHTELHQARLQVAQLTLQLSEEDLMLREERANSTLEREANKHAAETDKKKIQELTCELQRKEEWLQEERVERDNLEAELGREKVLLNDAKRELQELRSVLRKVQKEREEEQIHKQDLVNYIRQFEQKLGNVPETEPQSIVTSYIFPGSSSERDEGDAPPASSRSVSSPLFVPAQLEQPDRAEAPAETNTQSDADKPAFDTLDEKRQHCVTQAEEGKQLILPELVNPVLSELADSPMW